MPDVLDPATRSLNMSRIRSKNTRAEVVVFEYLRKHRIYFQAHYSRAPGCPDIALPRKKRAVFIDGDFWHGRTYEALLRRRGSAEDYWPKKIAANMARDKARRTQLQDAGWRVLALWESDIMRKRTQESLLKEIEDFLVS